jgi:aminoglycoside 3-N-acetyltransferase
MSSPVDREVEVIARTPIDAPRTHQTLAADLRAMGLRAGMTVLMHSSLSSLGWVSGGPVAVVQAVQDVLTQDGTLVMPTHSGDLSDPAMWSNPPVPMAWWPIIRASTPAFDPRVTPTRYMGRIVEAFRVCPGVRRSSHPNVSFAAWGRHAAEVTDAHSLDHGLGEGSPVARVYALDGWVVLLGVGYDRNTSFHLAEYRAGLRRNVQMGAPIVEGGVRVWRTYLDIDVDSSCFVDIGTSLEATGVVTVGQVGSAATRVFAQRGAVDFAERYLRRAG